MNLATLDLDLPVPLDHLLRGRSVTRAATRPRRRTRPRHLNLSSDEWNAG